MDGSCRSNQPCPAVSAERSRDELVRLPIGRAREGHVIVRGPAMECRSEGSAGGSRTAAWCVSPRGGDLSCVWYAEAGRCGGRGIGRPSLLTGYIHTPDQEISVIAVMYQIGTCMTT
jgi:hypothetical protein